ncbi:hypothetical protein CDO52_12715 [Nocardiopsis gilva YIM 90087]|uniref:Uncharacterized protein n=1 Tax=Nocardiopsis gilva YIM 90087 TaxID=1235441 RepID=A0A223S5X4_9ACTN|nr:hypothetical protein [Nocardiopsis gilva]ASU83533.1 hypothetical protein CDO52_12715 [Nocardiopsis gilva YIM 90087]
MTTPDDDLRTYTPEEVVEHWLPTATPDGLRKQAQRGKIAHRRIGRNRQIVFTRADIAALLDAAAVPVGEPVGSSARRRAPARSAPRRATPRDNVSALPLQPKPDSARRISF